MYTTITREAIKGLKTWSRVGFAVRCAARLRPLFELPAQVPNHERHMRVLDDVLRYSREFAEEAISLHDEASKTAVKATSAMYTEMTKLAWDLINDNLPKASIDYTAIAKPYETARRYLVSAVTAETMEGPDIEESGYGDDWSYVNYEECAELWDFQTDAKIAADSDYAWLSDQQKTDVVGPVPRRFFERPLWPRGEPSDWHEVLERHQRVATVLGKAFLERVDRSIAHVSLRRQHEGSDQWSEERNARRCDLIDKEIEGHITEEERSELEILQSEAIEHFDRVAPWPMEGGRRLHQQLLEKKRQQQERD